MLGGGPSQVSRRWVRSLNRPLPVLGDRKEAQHFTLPVGVAQVRVVGGGGGRG